jgi:diaminohydroxyphosphoribosylaminopyrimidine deaminase/5-amino-6-(5-phosphoribosylamino)uracil reductase
MVGAVIVHNKRIIGEGYHIKAGNNHAEVNAINSAPDDLLKDSCIYVSLEPCSHHGKTPPCAKLIVEKGIKKVVIGTRDTSSKVSGKGIEILKKGGCEVVIGVLEKECRDVNRRFFTYHEKDRPYVLLKWAESKDGFIDRDERADLSGPNWISGEDEKVLVHKWRTEEHSILVGRNTLIKDNPTLTARLWKGRNPLRLVLSDTGSFPEGLNVFSDDDALLLFSGEKVDMGGKKENILIGRPGNSLEEVLKELKRREIQSLMVEGGASILKQFIEKDIWDEARVFKGKSDFGSGLKAPLIKGREFAKSEFRKSSLIYLKHRLIK